jgi:hypothetical protein
LHENDTFEGYYCIFKKSAHATYSLYCSFEAAHSLFSMTPLCTYDTAVLLDLLFEWLWLPLKGISIEKTYITIPITFTQQIWGLSFFCHSSVIDTTLTKIGEFIVDFLREFEAKFKKALTRASGD